MAGGRGKRLEGVEKAMLSFRGKSMIELALDAMEGSSYIQGKHVATTKWTKKTEVWLKERDVQVVRTPGKGYVQDMRIAMKKIGLSRALVMAVDLPLIRASDIDFVVDEYQRLGKTSLAVMVPKKVFEEQGMSPSLVMHDLVPSGVNIVDLDAPGEARLVVNMPQFAANVNTQKDFDAALGLLTDGRFKYSPEVD